MTRLGDVHLVLFFTRGVSLRTWAQLGSLERELVLYERCLPHLRAVTFVSHGGREDLECAPALGEIGLVCNRWGLPRRAYRHLVASWLPRRWRGPTVVKSNQFRGADLALRAARRAGAAFVARAGYLPSADAACVHGEDSFDAILAQAREWEVFCGADRVALTSDALRERVTTRHGVEASKVRVIPNYVDTQRFRPRSGGPRHARRVCYVGRLEEGQKNLKALLEAAEGLDLDLHLIGAGPDASDLREQAAQRGLSVRFHGNLPNEEIAGFLRDCGAFVLPSRYEGHPKVLLEAMACGIPVIGTTAPGIGDLLRHRETGFLCDPSPESLRGALREVLGDPELGRRMGARARDWVLEHVALDRVVERELAMLEELAEATR